MFGKVIAIVLALLVANPMCCCQDLSSLLGAGSDALLSCGCQGAENEPERDPCPDCPGQLEVVVADHQLGVPKVPADDQSSPLAFFDLPSHAPGVRSGQGIPLAPQTLALINRSRVFTGVFRI